LTVNFAYDALGRRLFKLSKAKYYDRREAGPMWNKLERAKLDEQYGCGYTIYGWDGDVLALESRNNDKTERLTHYFFEPGSFVPVAQAVEQRSIQLLPEPVYKGAYDIDQDPVWQHKPKPVTFSALAWYQCDHLGTPMELTDEQGDIAWAGVYKAWGLAKEQRSETAKRTDVRNPLRFQGQYFDVETGLHYNRYRYYDPQVGRFIGKDPIGLEGGFNIYAYAPNPVEWIDPYGLMAKATCPICCDGSHGRSNKQERLRALADDPKQPSHVRGWIRNEMHHIETGNRTSIRLPGNSRKSKTRGLELAHGHSTPAKTGHCYRHSEPQNADLHKTQHRIGGY
jgi:RHS repeat-associated protein